MSDESKDGSTKSAWIAGGFGVLVAIIAAATSSYFSWHTATKLDDDRQKQRTAQLRALSGSFAEQADIAAIVVKELGDQSSSTNCSRPGPIYRLDTAPAGAAGVSIEDVSDRAVHRKVLAAVRAAARFNVETEKSSTLRCGTLVGDARRLHLKLESARRALDDYLDR